MKKIWTAEEEAERLRERFASVPNKAAFAREHKVPGGASMLSQHLSGHRPLNLEQANAYARGFGVTLEEISPRLAEQVSAVAFPEFPDPEVPKLRFSARANIEAGPDLRGQVPLISWIRAGEWCEAADPFQPGEAEDWLSCPAPHSEGTFALRVRGDSMTAPHGNSKTYPEGVIIFVDPARRSPVNGDRVVACLEGTSDATFKVYKNEDGRQWLQPLNPSHEPIRERFHILGTVIGKWEAD